MSYKSFSAINVEWKSIFYTLTVAAAAVLVTLTGLDGANQLEILPTIFFVYAGAAITALVFALVVGSRKKLIPDRGQLVALLSILPIMAISGLLFWFVSLEISILIATAALPIKVVVERAAGIAVFGYGRSDNSALIKVRLKARWLFDLALAAMLLTVGILASPSWESWSAWNVLILVLLVVSGVAAELAMLLLQRHRKTTTSIGFSPVGQVFLVNLGLALSFGAILVARNFVDGNLSMDFGWEHLALMIVGGVGVAIPGMLRLDLFRSKIHVAELCMLALAFPGSAYAIKLVLAAAFVVLNWATGLEMPEIQILGGIPFWSIADIVISLLVAVFIIDRLTSDYKGRSGDPETISDNAVKDRQDRVPEIPASLLYDSKNDLFAEAWETYTAAESAYLDLPADGDGRLDALIALDRSRTSLGLDAFRALPPALIRTLKRIERNGDSLADLPALLRSFVSSRRESLAGTWENADDLRQQLSILQTAHLAIIALEGNRSASRIVILRLRFTFLNALERASKSVSDTMQPLVCRLLLVNGLTGLERWAHRFAWVIRQFLTYEALLNTGIETSWGFRFVIPGTAGIGVNAGGWTMFYSGSLINYLTMAIPMRINPGFTIATAVFVWTLNRPGLGVGPSLPWGSAYVDSQRYKLLVGIDGLGYGRIGEWRGRGPYTTISGSLPFVSGIRITWNVSVFSPGFLPIVYHTTPFALRMQKRTIALQRLLAKLTIKK